MKCTEMSDKRSGWLHLATHTLLDVLDFKEMHGPPSLPPYSLRRDGRVVECTGFENRRTRKGIEGSNPSLSASSSNIV